MAVGSSRPSAHVVALSEGARVTPVELFLDLVFVYGFTQVTAFMADDLSWSGVVRGLSILWALWWLWTGFAWLGNLVQADEGPVRVVLFVVMAVVFIIDVTVPEAFVNIPGGLWGPWVFAACYLIVMLIHHGIQVYAAREVARLRRNTLLLGIPTLMATALYAIAGKQTGLTQTLLWVSAVVITYVSVYFIRAEGWQLRAASHFTERHGLMIIIALGESVVAIGVGVSLLPISWEIIVASVLGIVVLATMWWAYFDVVAIWGEHMLERLSDELRPRLARDGYTFLHYPMVAGIILLALGMKKAFEHLGDPMKGIALYALFGGVSLYLLALVAFKLRNIKTFNVQRIVVAVGLLALVPAASKLSALAALAILALIMLALTVYELLAFAPLREEVRHGNGH
ncbi:MAG TPA: low temperature requirement protein A [Candidatus Limnocylindrales bacterium]